MLKKIRLPNNLLNKFVLIGSLSECRVNIYPTRLTAKLAINYSTYCIVCYYNLSKKYHRKEYNDFITMMPNLHPEINGYVYANSDKYYVLKSSNEPTRLFISGNLSSTKDRIFFNAGYCGLTNNMNDSLQIQMQGAFLSNNRFITVVSDNPLVFNIDGKEVKNHPIMQIDLVYNDQYTVKNNVILSNKIDKLKMKSIYKTDKYLSDEQIKQWLNEIEIMEMNN